MILNKSNVKFDAKEHRYFYEGKELQGITGFLGRMLFPNKYDGIPLDVLERAARHGHRIHELLQQVDSLDFCADEDAPEVIAYRKLKASEALQPISNEYYVTERAHYASAIDVIYDNGDGTVTLGDFKTTCHLDTDYVSWQLSIYRALFLLLNPDVHVSRLVAIHLRGDKVKLVEVDAKPIDAVKDLLESSLHPDDFDADAFREKWNCTLPASKQESLPERYAELEAMIADSEKQIEQLKSQQEQYKQAILAAMSQNDVKKWTGNHISVTRVLAGTSERFDSKMLKEVRPEIYAAYVKTSQTKESIRIKVL